MVMAQPHYLLFCDTHLDAERSRYAHPAVTSSDVKDGTSASKALEDSPLPRRVGGKWHFILELLDESQARLEVTDRESSANPERLALLGVVRGLEALEQPSRVTLVTTSRYVSRGLRYGLSTWRESDYTWEKFGVRMPIRNADLWQRVDAALQFHGVTCRLIQSPANRSDSALAPQGYAESVEWDDPRQEHCATSGSVESASKPFDLHANLATATATTAANGYRETYEHVTAYNSQDDSRFDRHASGIDDRELVNAELMCVGALESIAEDLASVGIDGRAAAGWAEAQRDSLQLSVRSIERDEAPLQSEAEEKDWSRTIASTDADGWNEAKRSTPHSYFATRSSDTLQSGLGDTHDRWWDLATTWIRWWRGRSPSEAYPIGA